MAQVNLDDNEQNNNSESNTPQISENSELNEMQQLLREVKGAGLDQKAQQTANSQQAQPTEKEVDSAAEDLDDFFDNQIKTSEITVDKWTFVVDSLSAFDFLDGKLKVIDPEKIKEEEKYVEFLNTMFSYFIRGLKEIKKGKKVITIENLAGIPRTDPNFYTEAGKNLASKIKTETLTDVLAQYGEFFTKSTTEVSEKKSE